MERALSRYLERHADLKKRPLEFLNSPPAATEMAVVIPVLAEHPGIFDTLNDLCKNDTSCLDKTMVIVVVNNRPPGFAAAGDLENNLFCIKALREYAPNSKIRLGLMDAASPGYEMGPKDGVGHARKMGMDWAAEMLGEAGRFDAPIVCLDADTRVAENYLSAIRAFFQSGKRWGAAIDYGHPFAPGAVETPAILAYELYLRYCELGMRHARSPYAYHAIGSAMACSANAYVAAGGMKRRAAAEDFYFLQDLAKTGNVEHLWETRVRPSARTSHRAPIGTGKHVADFVRHAEAAHLVYHPESYRVLRRLFDALTADPMLNADSLMKSCPELDAYFHEIRFAETWGAIGNTTPDPEKRLSQFHIYFDALKTLRAIHHLRDKGLGKTDTLAAIRQLYVMCNVETPQRFSDAALHKLETALNEITKASDWRNEYAAQENLIAALREAVKEG